MKLFVAAAVLAAATTTANAADSKSAWKCTPTTIVVTRANGDEAVLDTASSSLTAKFPWDNVNLANVKGALKFIITETIDYESGVDKGALTRKNKVNFIDFYEMTYCNPANAVWWFSPLRPANYGDKSGYDNHGFGKYLTYDGGICNPDQFYCSYIYGSGSSPELGKFVGWQDVSGDDRNPTPEAFWYSAPGSCPDRPWSAGYLGIKKAKDAECRMSFPSGLCKAGTTPDGTTCTYSYKMLGQVNVDKLVGITDMGYKDVTAFMQAGNKEFVRASNYSFVSGLDFWQDPLNKTANTERVMKLIDHYNNKSIYQYNKPIPGFGGPDPVNPPCYCNVPSCTKERPCRYDDSFMCIGCKAGEEGCETVDYSKCKHGPPSSIATVEIPEDAETGDSGGNDVGNGTTSGTGSKPTSKGSKTSDSTVDSGASEIVASLSSALVAGASVLIMGLYL